jgi:hypothetical protein
MIVEPTPTNPRSPWRRALRLGGLVLPPALLAVVVGAGVLGPRPDPLPPLDPAPPAAALPGTSPAASAVPESPAVEDGPPIPVQFGDLGSVSAGDLVAGRREGRAPATVAVGGYLSVTPAGGCDDLPGGPLGPWCARDGVLADAPWPAGGGLASRPAHVHLTVPIGVRLPAAVERGGGGDHRVLAVGRFEDGAACGETGGRCDHGFIVERFAWADGVRVGLTPLVAERLDTGTRRPNPFVLAIDVADLPLSAVLVWPDAIATIDPAAAAIAAAGPANEPVWYLRVLDGARGPGVERRVRWMLLAEKDLRVLGSGRPGGPTADAGGGAG